jgi:hypothetical protein
MAAAMDAHAGHVVLVAVSAPSYAHGVIDPVGPVAAAAAERGIRCHVWTPASRLGAALGRPGPAAVGLSAAPG